MAEGNVFLSYSREQLYFAEGLSLKLQKAGIPVWMDLQRLEPGGDWREQIQVALQRCSALILIASRKALSSPYVELEWRAALNGGKCVYIALYEEVNLPSALRSASLVDFRGSFKGGLQILTQALKQGRVVQEQVQLPGWMNLPRKLPPGVQLIAWMLILEAIATPFILPIIRFPMISPAVWFINSLFASGTISWMWWKLLHRKHVHVAGLSGLTIPYFYFCFYLFSSFISGGMSDHLFGVKWLGLIVLGWGLIGVIYLTFGAEFLRWSMPGEDVELQILRRWFNKARREKRKQSFAPALQYALSARGVMGRAVSTLEKQQPRMDRIPPQVRVEVDTYSLHYAPADRPVAASLRRAFRKQKLREVNSDGDVQIVIMSEYLPRSTLEQLLDSQVRVIGLLVGNLSFGDDTVLERAIRVQLIDYRDRSAKILPALARTLKEASASNLQVSVETTPKSFHETVLPFGTRQIGWWVLSIGAYLLLSGLAALILSFIGMTPVTLLDLPGLLIGPVLIRQGVAFWQRRTTSWAFFPGFGLSVWLSISIFFLAFFFFSFDLPANPLFWILTPGKLLVLDDRFPLICFLPFTFFLVPFIFLENIVRYKNWLPASTRKEKGQVCLQALPDRNANYWVLRGWLSGTFLVFGLGPGTYGVYYFIRNVMMNF